MYVDVQTDGQWKDYSSQSIYDNVQELSSGFLNLGIKKGESIAIYAGNSPTWNIIDFAALQIGVVVVPIDPRFPLEKVDHIIKTHSIKWCFIENQEQLTKLRSLAGPLPTFYSFEKLDTCFYWEVLLTDVTEKKKKLLKGIQETILETDIATIVYTDKQNDGIQLSHKNILSTLFSLDSILSLDDEKNCLMWQSMSLVSERVFAYLYAYKGSTVFYLKNRDGFIKHVEKIRPHFFTGTPELLNQIYLHFVNEQKELKGIKKRGTTFGMRIAQKWINGEKPTWDDIRLIVVKQMMFRKWRKDLGGNIEGILLDGTPLSEELNKVFNAAGIPIRQSLGLAETSGLISMDRFNEQDSLYGSLGRPLPGVSIKIDEISGEILCKGPNVMSIVNNNLPHLKTIDKDGWLHTGVEGNMNEEGFLFLRSENYT